jgi:hypothetical protein
MNDKLKALVLASLLLFTSCQTIHRRNRIDENKLPSVILWAWERPENLEAIDTRHFGVAFLAQTLTLRGSDVEYQPRRQPLKVPAAARLIAVTRIESRKTTGEKASLTEEQRRKVVERVLQTLKLPQVLAVQVDFDAVTSERRFYRELLEQLRHDIPDKVPLSMTALASFCVGDPWLKDMPVDEAVPMVFRMGTDSQPIKNLLAKGGDFTGDLCRRSYGVALDEPVSTSFQTPRRVYVFNARAWSQSSVAEVAERFGL